MNPELQGVLYVVSTPIGNLDDITLRALKVLKEVEVIAAESVLRTKALLNHYGIKKKVISFRRENQKTVAEKIIKILKEGKNIALVSDAGTPGISDPGSYLVSKAREKGIKIVPIPGPSALITAISIAGLPYSGFLFLGFLPSQAKKRRKKLKDFCDFMLPIVIFESPHRLIATLRDIKEIFGNRKILLFKELTKVYEEVKQGYIEGLLAELETIEIRGEYVIIIMPENRKAPKEEDITAEVDVMLKQGISTIDIARFISKEKGIPYRKVYKKCLERKKIIYGG